MDKKTASPKDRRDKADSREDRLKAALKANIARRKAQARQRSAEQPSDNDNDTSEA